ncbi:MAG: hypothetical protein JW809_01725, partial [Pirellulales bacterium]|nr:hypothetical protein [Pirellulales bacterium]
AGLFVSDRPLPQSESSNVESAQLADRAVAIVAHRTNAVDRLTVSELRDVFAGKVINWPEETRRIELYGLSRNHELAGWFEQKIVGPTREARVRRRTSTAEVIEAVAASAVGIGFVDVAQIGPAEDRVKVVGLIPPDAERVLTPSRRRVPQDYPLAQPLLLYLSPEADGTTREFFDFLAAGGGRESLQKHGYVPSPPHRRLGGPRVSFSSRSAAREQQESESGGFLKEGG